MKRTDWLIADDGDELLDENGEYIEGPSNDQEAWEAIITQKGELVQHPAAGFGIEKRLRKRKGSTGQHETPEKFQRDLGIELAADGHANPEMYVQDAMEAINFTVNVE